MIKITATGNLGRDPEQSGKGPTKFSLASTRRFTKADGTKVEETEWLRCSVWGKLGEVCLAHLKKGRHVTVLGDLRTSEYEKDGVTHRGHECIVSEVEFGPGGKAQDDAGTPQSKPSDPEPTPAASDDIPF